MMVVLIVGQDADTAVLDYQFEPLFTWFVSVMLFIWFVGLAAAIVRPTRGLHDQLTGCSLLLFFVKAVGQTSASSGVAPAE